MAEAGTTLAETQTTLAAHLRDPAHHPAPPGLEDRRLQIYRDLLFNNVASLLEANFPVIRQLLGDEDWHGIVRDFFVRHRARTPLFHEIAQELIAYLANEREAGPDDPPFLLELAHYEWVELALEISEEHPDFAAADPNGDLLAAAPVLSPVAWPLSYRFPVHKIGPKYQPTEPPPEPTHLVVYRTRDDQVAFMEVNAVTRRLLQLVQENPDSSGLELLKRIADELQYPTPDAVITFGAQLLDDLRERGVLLGSRRNDV